MPFWPANLRMSTDTCENRCVMPFPFTAELIVERYLSGVRVDSFLLRHFRNYTPFRMQRIVRAGHVKIDGTTAQIDERVYCGDTVTVRLAEPPDKLHQPEQLPLKIVFEDPWIIVVDKPPGQNRAPSRQPPGRDAVQRVAIPSRSTDGLARIAAAGHRAPPRSHDERTDRRDQGASVPPPALDPIPEERAFRRPTWHLSRGSLLRIGGQSTCRSAPRRKREAY